MLRALSGPSAQELWAVGDAGALVSSSDWSSMSRYAQGTMSSVHGSSKDNLWAVGSSGVMRRSGMLWEGVADAPGSSIWTSGLADVWVVGDGFIHHWNGIEWEDRCPQYDKYQGVWGSSPTDVYVVGSKEALRWDGTQWTELAVVSRARPNLLAVHGDGAGHIWAVGAEGHAFSWDGQAFVPEPLDKTEYLTSVWVLGENDVWAASQFFDVHDRIASGHVHHWDAARWEVRYTVAGRLWAIWARSSNDVFAVGERGLVVHWDGTTWTEMEAGTGEDLHGLWGTAEDGPWAVGDNRAILRYAGTRADRDSRTSLPELGMHSTRSLARLSVPFELLGEEGDVGQRLVRGLAVGGG
jgi:hypothetical protein